MPAGWFDERFVSEGAQSVRLAPMRIALALLIGAVLAYTNDWATASLWVGCVLMIEAPFLALTRALVPGRPVSRAHAWATFAVYATAIGAWSAAGALLWQGHNPVCAVAAVAFFAGHLMYLQTHHSRALGSILPAIPALIAPMAIALIAPRFTGLDQVVMLCALAAVTAHAAISIATSHLSARDLARATAGLKLEKDRAQAARTAMAEAKGEAEAASQAKSAFLATMSHEIRTPLNGVLGMTQAMAAEGDLTPRQRERLQVIGESGEALLTILNDILDLAKVEAGKLAVETIPFDLAEVARGAHQTFAALAANKGLNFDLQIAPDAQGTYLGDPTRLRQILCNLISNALKFTAAGEVRVSLAREPDGPAGAMLVLRVADTGVGVAPEHLSRLFAKFEQADVSTPRHYGGAGLGLSICRELAALMGGTIEAASQPGAGTQFTVRLPLVHLGAQRGAEAPAAAARPGAGRRVARDLRVLAAEDNPVNQLVLKTLLAQIGVEPQMVETGEAAVAAWEAGAFDLILMDVQMPVMDGPTAARAIRAAEARSGRPRTPILALTANAMSHQAAEYAAAGMDGHVTKPIDAARLYLAIERAQALRDDGRAARERARAQG